MTTDEILLSDTDTGLSVRGNCWRARGIALASQASAAYWIDYQEGKAARRKAPHLAPWLR